QAGARRLTNEFLGGFYSLNGYYPGKTGQAMIANDLLQIVVRRNRAAGSPIDIAAVAASDPVAMYRQPEGPDFTMEDLQAAAAAATAAPARAASTSSPQPEMPNGVPKSRKGPLPSGLPLTLPPGLEQMLPLNKATG